MQLSNPWTAYQFDSAVTTFGVLIENASQEQIDVGTEDRPRHISKYTLKQLLTPGFIIEREGADDNPEEGLMGVDGIVVDEV